MFYNAINNWDEEMNKSILNAGIVIFLILFNSIASAGDTKKIYGDWSFMEHIDPITDKKSYIIATKALGENDFAIFHKYFAFLCSDEEFLGAYYLKDFFLGKTVNVTIRIDKEKPIEKVMGVFDEGIFDNNIDKSFIKSLTGKKKLFTRIHSTSNNIDMEFSLLGFDKAIQPMIEACNIK